LIIAHRLTTVRLADRIVVLEQGHVAEEGSRQELLARNGKYSHLYHLQLPIERDAVPNQGVVFEAS
jgi:ABC-type multidrug transport system fused ATPase/permease subunit